jgi:hypothetical protein
VGAGSGATQLRPVTALADGTFSVNASFIDLVNQFQLNNFGQATFSSKGDIRLTTTFANAGTNAQLPGELYTPGNLTFAAADVYPSTGTAYILDAVGPQNAQHNPLPTTISFQNNGVSSAPLSAGGTLLVDATDIVQAGTVRAPSGTLIFGVGDANDADTKTLFNSMPLVATESVTFAAGSVTSVSNGGLIIPYGTTIDGVEWQFNPLANRNAAPDLSAPPSKYIGVNGSAIALASGATIDLSGGGDLQAMEWVPGTGGTRDVLSQYNISYATSTGGQAVPVNVGAANVYAIVPGAQTPVAAYDPIIAQTLQPSVNANGTTGTTTQTIGIGQPSLDGAVGQSIYLQGVAGLPDGVYTLLPGKYATLPGAYRVTVNGTGTALPGEHFTAPDGTQLVTGYWSDALSGARSATPTLFNVQSGATWQQYSQYTLTRGDDFFATQAASKGNVTPALSRDAGQLVLAASQALSLGAKLNTAAADGGAPAQVDIASQDIQIVGQGETARSGYLQINAIDLDALGAGSLLIGGTRTQTTDGISIEAIANSVVVSNDAAHPLTGPEVILVTKTVGDTAASGSGSSGSSGSTTGGTSSAGTTDPNAAVGLLIDNGSVITATGSYPTSKDVPIFIGKAPDKNGNGAVSGDGALLMISNGAPVTVSRVNATAAADNEGLLTVGAGASLSGGQFLLLDSSGDVRFDPTASFSGKTIAVGSSLITFTDKTGADAAAIPGFVIGAAQIAQLANSDTVSLQSYSAIVFDGNVDARFGNSVNLGAGVFQGTGGAVVIEAPTVVFTNENGAAVPDTLALGSGSLTVTADVIGLGAGNKAASGFGAVTLNAKNSIVGQDTGTFDFGAAPVTMNAPFYAADTGSDTTVKTTGVLNLNPAGSTDTGSNLAGGAFSFLGGTVNDNGATILAPGGNVTLEASSGDLNIASGSLISAAGLGKVFFDTVAFAPAGTISLTSDNGTVNVAAGATLDFSGTQFGGKAGSLKLSAPVQTVNLAGTIKGGAAQGYLGGSFDLTTGGSVDLDNLAQVLASSGVTSNISVATKAGNLVLSTGNSIVARQVSLTADGGPGGQDPDNGHVIIQGTINASGQVGGEIDLYGKSGVDVEGSLIARACVAGAACDDTVNPASINPNQRGGTVNIGTSAMPNVSDFNATYGYENIAAINGGTIVLGANALIDVSGGTAGGLSGGTVNLRAPIVQDGGTATVNVTLPAAFAPGKGIVGSRATTLEAYAIWSTDDQSTGGKHFDGIVDPAGWYDAQGHLRAGTFTSQDGGTTFNFTPDGSGGGTVTNATTGAQTAITADQLQKGDTDIDFGGLQGDYFATTAVNIDHQSFYGYESDGTTPGTLMSFVQNGAASVATRYANTGIANFHVAPGVELDNTNPAINGGNISILTNWNLGAGNSASDLAFRFNGQAPIITFRAVNNVEVDASLTDGFFQIANPTGASSVIVVPPGSDADTVNALLNAPPSPSGFFNLYYYLQYYGFSLPTDYSATSADPGEVAQYEGQWLAYLQFLVAPNAGGNGSSNMAEMGQFATLGSMYPGQPTLDVASPTDGSDPKQYLIYMNAYEQVYGKVLSHFYETSGRDVGLLPRMVPPPPGLGPVITDATITVGTPSVDNTPSPVAAAGNALPLVSASLTGGSSTTFRVVAGADASSANPLSVQAAALFSPTAGTPLAGGGNVLVNGHFAYENSTNPNLSNSLAVVAPTMIRTGTGSIDISAANDLQLQDSIVPGVIYAGGAPADGSPAAGGASILLGTPSLGVPNVFVSPSVSPDSGGDVSISAQGDIIGVGNQIDVSGDISGLPGQNLGQLWNAWLLTGNPTGLIGTSQTRQTIQTSINFGGFDQGVMSVGGNVNVTAGGDIENLGVSVPTTWYVTGAQSGNPIVNVVGGGNLAVTAGGDILGGNYFVARGTGTLAAGGKIGPDGGIHTTYSVNEAVSGRNPIVSIGQVSTVLATQDGVLDVSARQGVDIGSVLNPSYLSDTAVQGYSATSQVSISATTGDIEFGTLNRTAQTVLFDRVNGGSPVLPATLDMTAFTGGIAIQASGELAPSPIGNLTLLADQTVSFSSVNGLATTPNSAPQPVFGMLDMDPALMPSSLNPDQVIPLGIQPGGAAHASTPLHADDDEPVRIYSLNGSIVDGQLEPFTAGGAAGFYDMLMPIVLDKPALIRAGADVLNLVFLGQNLRQSDVTRILAGHDIADTPLAPNTNVIPGLALSGPGTFDVEAGHNIGPLTNEQAIFVATQGNAYIGTPGIQAIGNANNPNLPHESANINVLFGVGPGINLADFIADYVDPTSAGVGDIAPPVAALVAFMQNYDAGTVVDTGLAMDGKKAQDDPRVKNMTVGQAWAEFQALPDYVQQMFAEQTLFGILGKVGKDFNDPSSPDAGKYERGYQALNTLFPAALGYTANNLEGGGNGANQPVTTGDLDMRSTTIQTQQGGNITILGPGGQALVGSTSAPPTIVDSSGNVVSGPGKQGILTLEQGDINIFTDRSVLLAQSRIFTEQGGAMTIWSSNGDINAGKGAKSAADIPPPLYVCDFNHYCTLDVRGEVSGAGIATLQTIPGAPASDANLIAPRGTVDAGDAGIRVSGNLNIAALHVANADNIQVQGKSTGIPIVAAVNVSALTSASAAATAAADAAENLGRQQQAAARQALPSIITVQVLGFGNDPVSGGMPPPPPASPGAQAAPASRYSAAAPLQFVGINGDLDPAQLARLNESERESVLSKQ